MAPADPPAASNGTTSPPPSAPRIGPHPGFISSANQYTTESSIRNKLLTNGCDPAREVNYRLQGVQLIDSVREHLRLPVRTFDTACVYFHKFRLNFKDAEYNYQDAALASLFVACKVEDTIKKSRDILAAAYNVKNPEKPAAQDDKMFETPGKIVIGLERLILETIGFDFRTRYPQKLLVKILRRVLLSPTPEEPNPDPVAAKTFFSTAYAMSIDLYKTFAPIKRTTFAMAMAVAELTARVLGGNAHILERLRSLASDKARLEQVGDTGSANGDDSVSKQQRYSRAAVTETMLDLLDLYVQNGRHTKVGLLFDQNRFIDIKIQVNNSIESDSHPRHLHTCTRCEDPNDTASTNNNTFPLTPASTTSPTASASDTGGRRTTRGQDGTMRFVFDPESARAEQDEAGRYFREEFEEVEVEVDEVVPPPGRREDEAGGRGGRAGRGRGRAGGFHRGRGDHRWGEPYGYGGRGRGGRGRYHH